MKCENCGKEVQNLYGVDDDLLIPYMNEWLEIFKMKFIKKKVCHDCCHGSKVVEWDTQTETWVFFYG